jgi:hypothetical protein
VCCALPFDSRFYLTAVGVGSRVGHTENTRACVLQLPGDLVLKLLPVNGLPAAPRARGIPALDHKVLDDAVELRGKGISS